MCVLSCVPFFGTLWMVARQAPLSRRLSSQEYWSGLLFPFPGDLPDPGIEPASPESPALAGGVFGTEPPGKPLQTWGKHKHAVSKTGCEMCLIGDHFFTCLSHYIFNHRLHFMPPSLRQVLFTSSSCTLWSSSLLSHQHSQDCRVHLVMCRHRRAKTGVNIVSTPSK